MDSGILLIDKEVGLTSRSIDNQVGHIFATRKVGHLGTLDPFAEGLLIVAVGNATKLLPYIDDGRKEYIATLKLGSKTDSGDIDGSIIETKPPSKHGKGEVKKAIKALIGKHILLPPMVSAVKIDGKPLYKYARQGEEVERSPRECEVYNAKLIDYSSDLIIFSCEVSKGTYIRNLGEMLATSLGELGHLLTLRRTSIGDINVKEAIHLAEVENKDQFIDVKRLLKQERIECSAEQYRKAINGTPITLEGKHDDLVLLTYVNQIIAMYYLADDGRYHCQRGLL